MRPAADAKPVAVSGGGMSVACISTAAPREYGALVARSRGLTSRGTGAAVPFGFPCSGFRRRPVPPAVRQGEALNTRSVAVLAFFLLVSRALVAQVTLGGGVTISFASVAEGKRILTSRDDFVERMSPFDRAARMKTDKDVSESRFLEFVGDNILEWNDTEKQKVRGALQGIQTTLEAMALPFPKEMLIIKTTGKEEGGAAYTRAHAIVLPRDFLKAPEASIQKTIAHELFHILSRANPALQVRLYAAIGFMKCDEVEFPDDMKPRKLTNPDAPKNNYCIRVKVADKEQWAIPILFSSVEKYSKDHGGEFFNYLQFRLLLVERPNDGYTVTPIFDGPKPMLVDIPHVSGFFEQVGKNTEYIIHPEEILADNFASLVQGQPSLPSPEVVERIQAILKDRETSEPGAASDVDKPQR